jgi:hypothetical protein
MSQDEAPLLSKKPSADVHKDGDYPASLEEVRHRKDLTESQRAGVLGGAAQRFYGLA